MALRTRDLNKVIAEVIGTFDGVSSLSVEQREGIANYVQRKDILAVLPTGHGKSLLFQLLTGICRALNTMGHTSYLKKAIVLVICPLNALIESHMKELRQRSISCTCLSGNDADQDGTYNGDYSVVFANPESLILNEKWRKMIQTPVYQTNLFEIVADEANVIPKWRVQESFTCIFTCLRLKVL